MSQPTRKGRPTDHLPEFRVTHVFRPKSSPKKDKKHDEHHLRSLNRTKCVTLSKSPKSHSVVTTRRKDGALESYVEKIVEQVKESN